MFKCKYRAYSAKKDEIKGIKTNNQKLTNKQKKNYKNDKEYIFEKKSYLCFSVIFVIYFCFFLFTYKYNFFVLQLFLL